MHSIDEDARRRFEAAWQSRQKPRIEDFLPPESADTFLPTLEELICIELELAWKRCGKDGGGPLVEGYWERFPQLKESAEDAQTTSDEPSLSLRLIQAEYESRQDFGDAPATEEYRRRFPEWTDGKIHPALAVVFAKGSGQDPADRCPAASEPADDAQRSLADEPVSTYRETFLRRHRTMAIWGAALLLVAIVASIAAVLMSL